MSVLYMMVMGQIRKIINLGSAECGLIEKMFLDHFTNVRLKVEPKHLTGSSDYAGFAQAGIPASGLFTGGWGVKTKEQAETYAGIAGQSYDPCYH